MTLGRLVTHNRTAILGITALLVVAGLWAAATMPVSIFPEVAFHRISIIARAGNLPVEQTLTALTQPLENALTGILGVETIRSMTTRGGVQLDLLFDWNEDMQRALQRVQAAMELTRPVLPPDTDFEARILDTSAFPIVGVAVTSRQRSLAQLSDFVIYEAAPQLRTIDGVYRVELNGARIREYALTLDPSALTQHRLDLAAVESAVRNANVIAAGGQVRDGYHLALTVVHGQGSDLQSLLGVVVSEDHGIPVTLGDIGTVEASLREDFTRAAANGKTAALIGISRQPSGNAVTVSEGVRQRVATLARAHPEFQFSLFYDQADLVSDAIASVRDSIALGLLLAVGTIFFFMTDLRTMLVAATVIPATVLISCIVLRALDMSFNLMTLGGIAAGIGLILDDAIVVLENLHRHRTLGHAGAVGLIGSIGEIARALVGSTLTPVTVLLPLGLLSGVPGAFFRPLAVSMSVALLLSLVLALSFTPALAAAVEPPHMRRARLGPGDRVAAWLARFYTRGLRWMLAHAWMALLIAVIFLGVAWVAYDHVETGFVPVMDEGAFVLDYWAPAGTSLQQTVRLLRVVDAILEETPEVTSFSRRTGAELGFFLTETNRGDYSVRLRRGSRRSIDAIMDDVREQIRARVPGLRVDFVQILQDMIGDLSGNPSPVEIKLFGSDQGVLQEVAPVANQLIAGVPGVVDNFDGITPVGPTYRIDVDEQRANLLGLNATTVQHWLETAVTGTLVGQVLEGDRAIPLRLRYPSRFRNRLDAVDEMTLVAPQGRLAPLRAIAHLDAGPLAVQHTRENRRQLVRVTARLDGRDLGSVTRAVQDVLGRKLVLPPGVTLEYGGLYASQQQAFRELLAVFFASVACVAALLLVEFGSIAAVMAIVIGSSLALSGSLLSLWVTGTALNVSSIVGMIMVVGIVAKNGILLLDFANREYTHTHDLEAALIRAGGIRLRPILMTSLAALAGLAPLALGIGAGSQMQQPLAIAILGGVSLSMLFSLIGVPLLYLLLARAPTTPPITHAPADR
ncbi:MAG TPA: efflux RND transporter permease subunit [Candidatus Margulisiibacteriota bacterium]|nr:efflux RND transporter permease subunit [Candidatus Margulisiibacteriota bacterium]